MKLPTVNSDGQALAKVSATDDLVASNQAYAWNSQDIDIAAAGTIIAVRNDSPDQDLVITHAIISGGNANTRYEVHKVTAAYTSGTQANGAAINGVPMGPGGGKAAATSHSDETGNVQVAANVFMEVTLKAVTSIEVLIGLVLGGGEAIAIDQVTESTAGAAIVFGYFVDRE